LENHALANFVCTWGFFPFSYRIWLLRGFWKTRS